METKCLMQQQIQCRLEIRPTPEVSLSGQRTTASSYTEDFQENTGTLPEDFPETPGTPIQKLLHKQQNNTVGRSVRCFIVFADSGNNNVVNLATISCNGKTVLCSYKDSTDLEAKGAKIIRIVLFRNTCSTVRTAAVRAKQIIMSAIMPFHKHRGSVKYHRQSENILSCRFRKASQKLYGNQNFPPAEWSSNIFSSRRRSIPANKSEV
ncbi:uncharacterized protein LOC129743089 [Uranotaenia lowii]|uniref:uncharacterized protein LOC129743089 n=1 Tax=Uranotaenia lowii TaxID=190385 RepID=UPI00247AFA79|nr:uncharacterized protein LOC129743089 [Uranotaenia lowii]